MTDILPKLAGAVIFIVAVAYLFRRRQPSGIPPYMDVFNELKDYIYFVSSEEDVKHLQSYIENFDNRFRKGNRAVVYELTQTLTKLLEDKRTELKNQASLRSARQASFT